MTRSSARRALDACNLVAARINSAGSACVDALELTALVTLRDRERGRRYAVRWLEETDATLDAAVVTVAALHALGGPTKVSFGVKGPPCLPQKGETSNEETERDTGR
jgi:hypothetical protein